MRIAFITLLLATSAFAQGPSGGVTSACGPMGANFDVKLDKSQHTLALPDPGKALVYFIQEKGADTFAATTGVGLDGAWVGTNKNDSHFAVSVEPGVHHVCANVQSFRGHLLGLVHFTAEAGKIYYFDAQIIYGEESKPHLFLAPADSDQAMYLIESYPLSVSTPKK
jgi:hypothetical protein